MRFWVGECCWNYFTEDRGKYWMTGYRLMGGWVRVFGDNLRWRWLKGEVEDGNGLLWEGKRLDRFNRWVGGLLKWEEGERRTGGDWDWARMGRDKTRLEKTGAWSGGVVAYLYREGKGMGFSCLYVWGVGNSNFHLCRNVGSVPSLVIVVSHQWRFLVRGGNFVRNRNVAELVDSEIRSSCVSSYQILWLI